MKTQWIGRVVTDTRGDAGAVILDDESTARVVLEDWLHDYYDIDAECLSEHLTASGLTNEARQYAMGLSAERSAEAIYEYMQDRGEPVSLGTAGEGWIAAEYLYAAAHEN